MQIMRGVSIFGYPRRKSAKCRPVKRRNGDDNRR